MLRVLWTTTITSLFILVEPLLLYDHWDIAVIVFTVLLPVPMGLELLELRPKRLYWLVSLCLIYGYTVYPDPTAHLWAVPYLMYAGWITLWNASKYLLAPHANLAGLVRQAALVYWTVGAIWVVFFLGGINPFGFSAVFVSLAAAHFFVAGFLLAVMAYRFVQVYEIYFRTRIWIGRGAMLGMPVMAAGITCTQLGGPPIIEQVAALAFMAWVTAFTYQHLRLGLWKKRYPFEVRQYWLWGISAMGITGLMAVLYAVRDWWPVDWVTLHNMQQFHGSLNSAAFSWLMLLGWKEHRICMAMEAARREPHWLKARTI